jgi:hypothetical protein
MAYIHSPTATDFISAYHRLKSTSVFYVCRVTCVVRQVLRANGKPEICLDGKCWVGHAVEVIPSERTHQSEGSQADLDEPRVFCYRFSNISVVNRIVIIGDFIYPWIVEPDTWKSSSYPLHAEKISVATCKRGQRISADGKALLQLFHPVLLLNRTTFARLTLQLHPSIRKSGKTCILKPNPACSVQLLNPRI